MSKLRMRDGDAMLSMWRRLRGNITDIRGTIPTKTSDLTNDGNGLSPYATQQYVQENGGKIDVIKANGVTQPIVNKTVDLDFSEAISNSEIDEICDDAEEGIYMIFNYVARAGMLASIIVNCITAWDNGVLTYQTQAGEMEMV